MWKHYAVVCVVVLVSGCNGGSLLSSAVGGVKYSSTADIRTALDKSGLTCSGYKSVAKDDSNFAEQGTADQVARCTVEGEGIDLLTFKDNGQQDNWLNMSKQMGCLMGSAFGVSNMHFVRGDDWGVAEGSQTISDKIAKTIGGEAVHIDCKDVKMPGA